MAQPIRKRKVLQKKEVEIIGLDYCDECFMFINGICNASDVDLGKKKDVEVPEWCGNNKKFNNKNIL